MTSSNPAGAMDRAISRIAGGCFGQKRILLMASLSRKRNGRGQTRLIAVHARGVAPPRRVLDQPRVARAEDPLRAIAEPDLELARQDDDELPPGRRVPVDESPNRILTKRDLSGGEAFAPVRSL